MDNRTKGTRTVRVSLYVKGNAISVYDTGKVSTIGELGERLGGSGYPWPTSTSHGLVVDSGVPCALVGYPRQQPVMHWWKTAKGDQDG